jgi:immune inhibitor A
VTYQFFASHPSLPPVSLFNDANTYWSPAKPDAGVIVPNTGTTIRVVSTSAQDNFMLVHVNSN